MRRCKGPWIGAPGRGGLEDAPLGPGPHDGAQSSTAAKAFVRARPRKRLLEVPDGALEDFAEPEDRFYSTSVLRLPLSCPHRDDHPGTWYMVRAARREGQSGEAHAGAEARDSYRTGGSTGEGIGREGLGDLL